MGQEVNLVTQFAQTAVPFYLVYMLLFSVLYFYGKKKQQVWLHSVIRTTIMISVVFFSSLFYLIFVY